MTAFVLRADARALPLSDESIDLIVTSPPYWRLRDYRDGDASLAGQIGTEDTPAEYIANLIACTREWARVLKPSGSIFVVLGDKYSDRADGGPSSARSGREDHAEVFPPGRSTTAMAPRKSLLMLPERYRIACVDGLGLIARAKIVWHKPSALPESVTDRVKTAHEDIVHLTKAERYYSSVDEIREPASAYTRQNGATRRTPPGQRRRAMADTCNPLGALPGSVWRIASQPFTPPASIAHAHCCRGHDEGCGKGLNHFAAYPPTLVRRIVLGWSPPGICTACGEGRRPELELGESSWARRKADGDPTNYGRSGTGGAAHLHRSLSDSEDRKAGGFGKAAERRITGYACACSTPDAPTRPAVVVDAFGGTGCTSLVASALGRIGISCDLSHDYGRLAQWRTTDPGERARALDVPKPPPVPNGQGDLFADEVIA